MTPANHEATLQSGFNPATFLAEHSDVIDRIARSVCRRQCYDPDEIDDFVGWVYERLSQNDYAVLRKFQGRCSWGTYLQTVISNLQLDDRVARWGRWRSSSLAKRRGDLAVRLECLLYRDGYTFQQAVESLRAAGIKMPSQRELARLAAELFRQPSSRKPAEVDLAVLPARGSAEADLLLSERQELEDNIKGALERAIKELEPEDQVLLQLHYWQGMKVSEIARALGLEQKPLYDRFKSLSLALRARLTAAEVSNEMVTELLNTTSWDELVDN